MSCIVGPCPLRRITVVLVMLIVGLGLATGWGAPAAAQTYTWRNAVTTGGGFVDGIIAHPAQQGLFYARTDVGGAYRYNAATSNWVPLLDWTSAANWWQLGVETIAIDPSNANMLYMVVGLYSTRAWGGNGAVLVSSNQGATFSSYPLPFQAGSNELGRNGGERLQVDPYKGSILFYGTMNSTLQSATNGLYTSTNSGQTWTRVTGFPALSSDSSGAGVVFLAFDTVSGSAGSATPILFAGVSDDKAAATVYESTNGGLTWWAVPGAPLTGPAGQHLYPTRGLIGANGTLYVTYADNPGPNGIAYGQVWKYAIQAGIGTNITPPNPRSIPFGYSGLALDASKPGSLVVTTMDRWWPTDTMFRTTNDGATWTDVGAVSHRNAGPTPWIDYGAATPAFGNWPAAVVIDPYNANHAMYGTGYSVWATTNLTAAATGGPVNWAVGAQGIEETVVEAVMSPSSGPAVISAIYDLCGFAYPSVRQSPQIGPVSPVLSHCTGLDYAKNVPGTMVVVGDLGDDSTTPYGLISTNGGAVWTPFPSMPDASAGDGTVAISADAKVIVWAPSVGAPAYTTDGGTTWTSLAGTLPAGVTVLSDGQSAQIFYAFYNQTGVLYASFNQGVSWSIVASGLHRAGTATAVAGRSGDVWLSNSVGLFHSTNAGISFSQVANVTAATAVGFGKAAAGASYPAVYLIGTVSGVTGVFRSTNGGTNWVQINNAANQWAGPVAVAGDSNSFGTVYLATSGRGVIYGTSPK